MRRFLCILFSFVSLAWTGAASGQTVFVYFDIQPMTCPNTFDPPGPVLEITGTMPRRSSARTTSTRSTSTGVPS